VTPEWKGLSDADGRKLTSAARTHWFLADYQGQIFGTAHLKGQRRIATQTCETKDIIKRLTCRRTSSNSSNFFSYGHSVCLPPQLNPHPPLLALLSHSLQSNTISSTSLHPSTTCTKPRRCHCLSALEPVRLNYRLRKRCTSSTNGGRIWVSRARTATP
jgi:hypothetical protein